MQVRELVESTDYMIELTTENGMITIDDEGNIDLEISVEDGEEIDVDGLYDLYVISVDDKPERVLEGLFRFYPAVTRDD
jgi:RNase P/RNase MRP subunit p29